MDKLLKKAKSFDGISKASKRQEKIIRNRKRVVFRIYRYYPLDYKK